MIAATGINPGVVALGSALAGVVSTVLAVFYGPRWKARLDRRRELADRSERLIARYSEPLARAAFDLQSRLYNIMRSHGALSGPQSSSAEMSTAWLFGQYLAWLVSDGASSVTGQVLNAEGGFRRWST